MAEAAPGTAGPAGALPRLAASLLAIGRIRLELLAIEVQEEKERIVQMLVWAVVTTFLGCFALVFLALFLTVLLWDSHRLLVMGLSAALFLLLAAVGVLRLRALLAQGPSLLQGTLAELREDSRALQEQGGAP